MKNSIAQLAVRAICSDSSGAAPKWIELLPVGPHLKGRDGREWMLIDPQIVIAAFAERGLSLPVDYEHSTEYKGPFGDPAPAVGWIEELEVRDGAVWGRVEWTEEGRKAVEKREYRYLSPVFDYTPEGRHILRLTSVGLTNMPNLPLTALNNQQKESKMSLKAICQALGLKEDASEQDVLTAIAGKNADLESAKNRQTQPDLTKFVPRAEFDRVTERATNAEQKLADRESADLDAQISTKIDAAVKDGKIAPASKDYFTAMCRTEGGLAQFDSFVANAPKVVADSGMNNNDDPKGGKGTLTDEERAACRLMGTSEEDFLKTKKEGK